MGRKSYAQVYGIFLIFLARKLYQDGGRPLREVATLLAKAGFRTRTGKPFGPAAVQKMVRSDVRLSTDETRECEQFWNFIRFELMHGNRNKERVSFQWLKH
jgi:hypothetical protein